MIKKPPKVLPLKFLFSHPAHFIAGGFGSGYSPWAPGTTGTLFGWASYLLVAPQFPELWQMGPVPAAEFCRRRLGLPQDRS